ncbi:MAG: C2 family cysteine protease [Rivularia sp. ALOHA_DT_140]|nr:C2 family cysteine protease [Rivularia sp. ALOHA_DT_140]
MSIENGGDLFGSSTSLNTSQNWQTIEDSLGLNNKNDYYSFELSNRSSFELVLNNLSDNADVSLLNSNGSKVASSSRSGTKDETIARVLDAGTYFIEVHQVDDAEISYGLEYRSNYIPEAFSFNAENIEGGIKLTDTKIFDGDGSGDISKVDFWLKKQGGYWKKVGNVSEFRSNNDGSIGFDYDISNLEEGEYYIWGRATDKFGARSNGWGKIVEVNKIVNPEVDQVAPANLSFTTENISGGIKLNNAKVYDANGVDDLERIDFELKQDDGEWIEIQDAVEFSENSDGSIGFDYSISNLEQGDYQLRATAYDKAGEKSESLKSFFRINNVAPSDLRFEVEVIEDRIRVTDGQVFDANGINNLNKVDFWLKKDDGNWQNIDDAVEFRTNEDGSIGFDYSIENLETGNYILWAITRDNGNSYSNSSQQSFVINNNAAPTQLDFNLQQINGGIKLNDAWVFDADGIDDLERVDFQLKEEGGEWIEIADALNFSQNQNGSIGFDYSITGLEKGNYQLRSIAYDKAGLTSDPLTTYFKVNNVAPSDFSFDIEAIEDGVRVTNTKVFDANGINDLSRVDFWLKKDDGSWQNIADAVEFRNNGDGSFSFDYTIDSLAPGDYVLWARTRDKTDSYSNISQKTFQVVDTSQPQLDWFDTNIKDESIRTLSRSLFSDNTLDRNDMITILRDAKDGNIVDAAEITDLRTLVDNASNLGIQDYVRVLSSKVVYGDTANKSGNLQTGSSAEQLDKLINKWFLGSDRPQTPHTYQYANGSLFQNGISHDDIRQGYINDCFFLAGLGATVVQSPEVIRKMFIDYGDGTFTVRFYNNGVADYVTVDRYLPTNNIGNLVYANAGDYHGNANNELWVALAEKAYAQLNESGWINQDNTNSYNGIGNAGYLSDAFAHITGEKAALGRFLSFDKVVNAFNAGEVVGFGSKSSDIQSNIVTSHAYALVDYNADTQKFTLLNPWSTDNNAQKSRTLELSWSEIASNFSYWDSTISNLVST